jgi:hypothetical protein
MANRSNISLVGNTTTGQNLGTGAGVYKHKSDANNLQFRSISGIGEGIWVFEQGDEIRISGQTAGLITGVSTAQNVGVGQGVFDSKFVNILQLRSLLGSGNTTVTTSGQTLVIYSSGGTSEGGGGFLGMVTQSSAEPTPLYNNQWVKPKPTAAGIYNYTFTNFLDSGSTAINVNLSTQDAYLRYQSAGDYWIKESYNRPLASGKTWIGTSDNIVCEAPVIDEWVSSESALSYMGQKYAYCTHTVAKTDLDVCNIWQHYIYTQNIPLTAVGNTAIMTIPSGKCVLFNRFKLIIRQDAPVTSFTVSVGTNSSTYNNLSPAVAIDNVLTNETYDLEVTQKGVAQSAGSIVYFRVSSASSCPTLCANLLSEGFIY